MTRFSKKVVQKAARSMKRTTPHVESEPHIIGRVHMARQLVRVERVSGTKLFVVIPGVNPHWVLEFATPKDFPPKFRVKGYRFFARANLAAELTSEVNITGPFEKGGKGARTRLTSQRISAELRAAPRPQNFPRRTVVKAPTMEHVPLLLLKKVATAMKSACVRRVGEEFERNLDISAQDAIKKVNVNSVVSAVLAGWRS